MQQHITEHLVQAILLVKSVSISTNGYIHMVNTVADFFYDGAWGTHCAFRTSANSHNGDDYENLKTYYNTNYYFDWTRAQWYR